MTTILGDVTPNGQRFDVRFDRVLATDIDDAWQAVSTRERLARWMNVYTGDLRLGGTWQALLEDGSVYCVGTVTECDRPRSFTTTWEATDEGPTTLTVTLEEVPGGTRLTLTHIDVISVYLGSGWQTYLEQLEDEVGTGPGSIVDPDRKQGVPWDERFSELHAAYKARFGGGQAS